MKTGPSCLADQSINHPCYGRTHVVLSWNSDTFPAVLELSLGTHPYVHKGTPSARGLIHIHLVHCSSEGGNSSREVLRTLFLQTDYNAGAALSIFTEHKK